MNSLLTAYCVLSRGKSRFLSQKPTFGPLSPIRHNTLLGRRLRRGQQFCASEIAANK
jgi:hypothetical protein